MPAGSFIGALSVATLGDKLGRKKTIILSGIIWVIGCILQCASQVSFAFPVTVIFPASWITIAFTPGNPYTFAPSEIVFDHDLTLRG